MVNYYVDKIGSLFVFHAQFDHKFAFHFGKPIEIIKHTKDYHFKEYQGI